ncbi:hypothetical protein BT93_E2681 [Corymbia citriodora subsp. variegata]|nr:hypothetical protein BT93_E2681 [Corymbia citriodora subsp. variegata]
MESTQRGHQETWEHSTSTNIMNAHPHFHSLSLSMSSALSLSPDEDAGEEERRESRGKRRRRVCEAEAEEGGEREPLVPPRGALRLVRCIERRERERERGERRSLSVREDARKGDYKSGLEGGREGRAGRGGGGVGVVCGCVRSRGSRLIRA